MSQRDELAELIQDVGEYIPGSHADDYVSPTKAADAILVAGYRKPRTITTVEELDALPEGSVVLGWNVHGSNTPYLRAISGRGRLVWGCVGSPECYESEQVFAGKPSATVLYEPEASDAD